jgi:Immunoglobulin I-set domain/Fibronectin type III domain
MVCRRQPLSGRRQQVKLRALITSNYLKCPSHNHLSRQTRRLRGHTGEAVHQASLERIAPSSARQRGPRRLLPLPSEQWHRYRPRKSDSAQSQLYVCLVNVHVNAILSFQFVSVAASPYFSAPSRMVNVKKGDTAILQCEVNGDKPINVVWLRGGKFELNPSTNYRVSIKQDATPEGISAEVQITNVESSDSGQYFCQASNLYGRDQQLVQLQVQEPPQPPSALETAIVASRSVSLKWQPRGGDAAEVTKYIVEYREFDRQWQYLEISDPPQYTAVIENLKPATKYSFRVIAEGPAGKSAPSQGE